MSGEEIPTRELASRWLAAVRRGGIGASDALELTTPNFRLHLPRSLAPLLKGAGLDVRHDELAGIDHEIRRVFDVQNSSVVGRGFDIFQGDRGGLQATVNLRTVSGQSFDVQCAATFQRDGDKLAAVWVHADTAEVKQRFTDTAAA